jgi:hypothetical protein
MPGPSHAEKDASAPIMNKRFAVARFTKKVLGVFTVVSFKNDAFSIVSLFLCFFYRGLGESSPGLHFHPPFLCVANSVHYTEK